MPKVTAKGPRLSPVGVAAARHRSCGFAVDQRRVSKARAHRAAASSRFPVSSSRALSESRESVEWRRGSALNLIDVQREHEFPTFEPLCFSCGVFKVDVVGDRQAHIHLRQLMDWAVDTLDAGGLHIIDRV